MCRGYPKELSRVKGMYRAWVESFVHAVYVGRTVLGDSYGSIFVGLLLSERESILQKRHSCLPHYTGTELTKESTIIGSP